MDGDIDVFRNVARPQRLHFEFQCETGLLLRCDGKVGIPFQTKQGNRPSCRDQEGRRVSDSVVPGNSVFLSSENGMSGTFWVASRVSSTISNFKRERGISLETLQWERASSRDDGGSPSVFSSCGGILELQWVTQGGSRVGPGKSNLH